MEVIDRQLWQTIIFAMQTNSNKVMAIEMNQTFDSIFSFTGYRY